MSSGCMFAVEWKQLGCLNVSPLVNLQAEGRLLCCSMLQDVTLCIHAWHQSLYVDKIAPVGADLAVVSGWTVTVEVVIVQFNL